MLLLCSGQKMRKQYVACLYSMRWRVSKIRLTHMVQLLIVLAPVYAILPFLRDHLVHSRWRKMLRILHRTGAQYMLPLDWIFLVFFKGIHNMQSQLVSWDCVIISCLFLFNWILCFQWEQMKVSLFIKFPFFYPTNILWAYTLSLLTKLQRSQPW